MELGTVSILAQLLLILALVAVFAGRRHLKARRERLGSPPPGPAPAVAPVQATVTAVPVRAPRPVVLTPEPSSALVSEELLPACFADTCADWAHTEGEGAAGSPIPTRFSLADWSAPTDRVALDEMPDLRDLGWAEATPVVSPRPARPLSGSGGAAREVLHNRAAGAPLRLT